MPDGNSEFFIFPTGTITLLNPCFFASFILCSIRLTLLTSPVKPTSPIKQSFISTATSLKLDATATTTPKSTAGSSIFTPPDTLTYTSCCCNKYPAFFSKTAISKINLLYSNPVDILRGLLKAVGVVND